MSDWIASFTSLPNIHPALVHFPIALLPVAVLLDAFLLWRPAQRDWLDRAASFLYLTAAVGAGVAYWTGRQAAEALPRLALPIQTHVNEHSDSARAALWLLGVLALVRLMVTLRDTSARRKIPRFLLLALALGGTALVYRTADLGGGLVYQHRVGVAESDQQGVGQETAGAEVAAVAGAGAVSATDAAARMVEGEDGGLVWQPLRQDGSALGTLLLPAPETDASAVAWLEPAADAAGLDLDVDGEAILLLPGTFGDVEVRAVLDLEGFEGEVGLAHHVRSGSQAGLLTVSLPENEFALTTRAGGEIRQLARGNREVPDGPFELAVSVAGRHLYGLLGAERVVHGHEPPPPDGGCGLYIDGTGTVRVVSLSVTPGTG